MSFCCARTRDARYIRGGHGVGVEELAAGGEIIFMRQWACEKVDPDMEVVDDPAKMVDGGDPQLDAAIKHMLAELKAKPYKAPPRPKYPDRSEFGLEPADK